MSQTIRKAGMATGVADWTSVRSINIILTISRNDYSVQGDQAHQIHSYSVRPLGKIRNMKYTINIFSALILFFASCSKDDPLQQEGQVIITTAADGILTSDGCSGTSGFSAPKVLELYINGTVDMSDYSFQVESNGVSPSGIEWSSDILSELGSVSNDYVYLVTFGETTFAEMYPDAKMTVVTTNFDGNDAIRIVNIRTNIITDILGDPYDVSDANDNTAAWDFMDSFIQRNQGSAPNYGVFNPDEWRIYGTSYFSINNITTCDLFIETVDLGTF